MTRNVKHNELDFLEEIKKYHTVWKIREEEYCTKVLTEKLEIHIIELGKIRRILENKDKELDNKVAVWTTFLLNPEILEEKDMEENKDVKMAKEKYEEVLSDEQEERRAFRRQIYYMDMASAKAEGVEDGVKIGYEEGEKIGSKQKAMEIAKKMLKEDFALDMIIKLTGLTKEEIEALK